MRFHIPSFLTHLEHCLPDGVDCVHHHYICYLFSGIPLRMDFLKRAVIDAVVLSYEKPIGTLTSTEQRSVIGGLLDAHYETLEKTLSGKNTYLKKAGEKQQNRRESPRYEYQINLRILIKMLKDIRIEHDIHLIEELIHDDLFTIDGKKFVSLRKLEKLIFYHTGQAFSWRRIDEALHELQRRNVINGPNGFRYRFGREVRT